MYFFSTVTVHWRCNIFNSACTNLRNNANQSIDSNELKCLQLIQMNNTAVTCFGVLKSMFRCLDKSGGSWLLNTPEKACAISVASAVLHNFCISHTQPGRPSWPRHRGSWRNTATSHHQHSGTRHVHSTLQLLKYRADYFGELSGKPNFSNSMLCSMHSSYASMKISSNTKIIFAFLYTCETCHSAYNFVKLLAFSLLFAVL